MLAVSGGALLPQEPPTEAPIPCREKATIQGDGKAVAPTCAPTPVKRAVRAGNRIRKKPYIYGGGHGGFTSTGYDCSGSVSYMLHGAGVLDAPLASGALSLWGRRGKGDWITVYANAGHTYATVAGLRFDTSGMKATGNRWQETPRSRVGYRVRHPAGL